MCHSYLLFDLCQYGDFVPRHPIIINKMHVHMCMDGITNVMSWQDVDMPDKRTKTSLSIVAPLDVLRQRLLLEIARRQMRENSIQVNKTKENK